MSLRCHAKILQQDFLKEYLNGRAAKDWPWSSYRATAGPVEPAAFLNCRWILSNFGKKKGEAIERYRRFVSEGKKQPSPWASLKNQIFLGSDNFIEKIQLMIDTDRINRDSID